ncbi:MAG: hypothetical protein BWX86_02866 [Verrucomicrobia bacterium ADurb.Bin122]|nr:MAG: hypothetical protein BWX86_02866 [Verrucomicrobia bacterium ADurb.Bin122]
MEEAHALLVAPLLDGEDEEEAVDETEELLEIGVLGELAGVQALAEDFVFRMREEAGAERKEGVGHTVTEAFAHGFALLLTFLPPDVPDAGGGGVAGAGGVKEAPDGGEVGVTLVAEDELEVGLEVGRAREGVGIAHEAELAAVGEDGPGAGRSVEELLRELVGRAATRTGADDDEALVGLVEREIVRGDDERHPSARREGGDGIGAVGQRDRLGATGDVGEAEGIAKEIEGEAQRGRSDRNIAARADGVEVLPERGGDAEGPALLIGEGEPLRDAVVGSALPCQLAPGRLLQDGRHKEATLELEGIEDQVVGGAAGHGAGSEERGERRAGRANKLVLFGGKLAN